jgi:regulator of sigma E protease
VGAAVEAARYCRDNATLLFLTIKHLVRMDISARVLSGPIEIARASGESLRTGPAAFIHLLAFVSIQLGVINLFPIPGLDGGHMLILIVEGIFRRELPEQGEAVCGDDGLRACCSCSRASSCTTTSSRRAPRRPRRTHGAEPGRHRSP